MSKVGETETRDWQPGDGLVCTYSKRSPIPCQFPTKTRITTMQRVYNGGVTESVKCLPVCAMHAISNPERQPGVLMAKAQKIAAERLVQEHLDDYAKYVTEAIAEMVAQVEEPDPEESPR